MKYILYNLMLLIGIVPALFFGLIGVDTVLEIKTLDGYIGMMFFSGYLLFCTITTSLSIKHYHKD